MVQKIIWSDDALFTFENSLQYLERDFSKVEVQKFTNRISEKLLLIKSNPRLGRKIVKKPNVYKSVINKRIVLVYHYKPVKKRNRITNLLEHAPKSKEAENINRRQKPRIAICH